MLNVRHQWTTVAKQKAFLNALGLKLNIQNAEGWYKVTSTTLKENGGSGLLEKYKGSVSKLLTTIYPEYHRLHISIIIVYTTWTSPNLLTCRAIIGITFPINERI